MNSLLKILVCCTILFSCHSHAQGVFTTQASGNWDSPSTWTLSSGADSDGIPDDDDDVIIGNHNIAINVNVFCNSIRCIGALSGSSIINVKNGIKLMVYNDIIVEPNDNYDVNVFIDGIGEIETNNLQVGLSFIDNTFPNTTRLTTLNISNISYLKINGNLISTTPVNTNPVAYNESRIRHRSGTIDLYGIFDIQVGNPGPSGLGYRTDNSSQGDSYIIIRNGVPNILGTGQTAPTFSGGTIEFNTTATGTYILPVLVYKNLILNSNRTFRTTNAIMKINENGKLYLTKGTLFAQSAGAALGFDNNTEIIISSGVITNADQHRPRLTNINNKIDVTYNEKSTAITTGKELIPVFNNIPVSSALRNLNINNSNGIIVNNLIQTENLNANITTGISGSGNIKISNTLNIQDNTQLSMTDNILTLSSTSENTARINQLSTTSEIFGNIKVERYLPNNKRQWRLLTAPLKGNSNNSVYYNWQNNGIDDGFTGAEIWGPDGNWDFGFDGNGLVLINNSSYNLRKFNNNSGTWSNVTNTINENLFEETLNKGFLFFVTHPFLSGTDFSGGFYSDPLSTTLIASGQLITGNVNYSNILNNKFYLIGNPYASPIDFEEVLAEPENSGIDKVWFIDPTIGTLGSYVTWQEGVGFSNVNSSFNGNSSLVFQSGEAFFVRATTTTSTLTIKEAHKTDGVTNTTLNRNTNQSNTTNYELFRILLEKQIENNFVNADGCVVAFYTGGNNEVDSADGNKLSNPGENIALVNSTSLLSIEHRNSIETNDFLTLRISNATVGTNYKLKLYTENFEFDGYAYLQDLFLGSTTEIPLDGSVFEYEYQITENTASTGSRFKILFQNTALSNSEFTASDFMLYPNPVNANESFTIKFHSKANEVGSFDCKIYNALGQLIQNNHLDVVNGSITIPLISNFKSGAYFVEILNTLTQTKTTKSLIIE